MNTETKYYYDSVLNGIWKLTSTGKVDLGAGVIETTPELKAILGTEPRELKLDVDFRWRYETRHGFYEWRIDTEGGYSLTRDNERRIIAIPVAPFEVVEEGDKDDYTVFNHVSDLTNQLTAEREMSARLAEQLKGINGSVDNYWNGKRTNEDKWVINIEKQQQKSLTLLTEYNNHLNKSNGKQ